MGQPLIWPIGGGHAGPSPTPRFVIIAHALPMHQTHQLIHKTHPGFSRQHFGCTPPGPPGRQGEALQASNRSQKQLQGTQKNDRWLLELRIQVRIPPGPAPGGGGTARAPPSSAEKNRQSEVENGKTETARFFLKTGGSGMALGG